MSLISKASREELEVLALHGEAALTGIGRRCNEDDVTLGKVAAAGERGAQGQRGLPKNGAGPGPDPQG